jgi:hypothetical protein
MPTCKQEERKILHAYIASPVNERKNDKERDRETEEMKGILKKIY